MMTGGGMTKRGAIVTKGGCPDDKGGGGHDD